MTKPLRILHLEDDDHDAELVNGTLVADGLAVQIVRVDTRAAFVDALRADSFDVILADYNLPAFDGVTAQSIAAECRPDTPFIFLSGTLGEELAVDRLKAGATDYVLKQRLGRLPSSIRRALSEASERLERRRAEGEIRRLNAELEQRVAARTAELANANAELARREADLSDAKSFLEDLIAASPSMIFRLDPLNQRMLYASPNIGWLLGYSVEEVVGVPNFWDDLIHPDDRERVTTEIAAAIEAGQVQIEQEYRLRSKDGRYRWFFGLKRVGYNANMRPETMLGYYLDIADRKAAEEALLESEERTRSILRTANDAFIAMGADGRIADWNEQAETIFGWSRAEALGRRLAQTIIPEAYRERHERGLARYLETGESVVLNKRIEMTALRRDGTEFPVELTIWGNAAVAHRTFNAFVRDITEQKRAEALIRQAKEEAERANHAKSDFLSRMSHDLRTPLNAVLGFAQLLETEKLTPEQLEGVRQIMRGGRHLLGLINEVLDIARIEAGHLSLSPEPVDPDEIVRHAVALVTPLAAERGIALTVKQATNGRLCVHADRQRLNQVLLNLLSNGVKYTRSGGSVTVGFEAQARERLRITVTDTGAGIAPEKLKLLFTPFERLGAERTAIEGTGLGLALARGLTEAMGGTLGVTTEVDRGSVFWIELPCGVAAEIAEPSSASPHLRLSVASGATGTVLYIEDNASNVHLMQRVMNRRPGVRLLHAPEGRVGVDMARQSPPDLILLDLHLPDMHGEEVLQCLWEDPTLRAIPVAILSADATPAQAWRLTAAGARAYLTKPLDIAQVLDFIDASLADSGQSSSSDSAG